MSLEISPVVQDLLSFINGSPTPWHAVAEIARRLDQAGYRVFDEREAWELRPGTTGYVVRGGGTIAAFRMGEVPPHEGGFVLLAAHTDSPGLRLKPRPEVRTSAYSSLGVEVYGGALLHTWLDRDLSVSGRVALRNGRVELVRLERVARVPSLAIHLDRGVNSDGLKLNPQSHLKALSSLVAGGSPLDWGTLLSTALPEVSGDPMPGAPVHGARVQGALVQGALVQGALVQSAELCFHDAQPAEVIGGRGELISSPRLDNLASCHATISALLGSQPRKATQMVVLYDHEEVGSGSAQGAESQFLMGLLARLASTPRAEDGGETLFRALARSFLVSTDMAHAVHPNYSEKHDEQHSVLLGGGPVIKVNASQRYATDALSQAVFAEACAAEGVRPQYFVSRSDLACGSTIGPISAARTGIRTVDVGNPMLSMHSARELAAVSDVAPMIAVLRRLLNEATAPAPAF